MQTQTETTAALRTSSGGGSRALSATTRWEQVAAAAGIVFVAMQLAVGGVLGHVPGRPRRLGALTGHPQPSG